MSKIILGLICGLVFGVIDVLVMIPLKFEDRRKKKEAMLGALIERFMLGFLIPNTNLGVHQVIAGLVLGVGLSLPTAIITRTYLPIISIGIIGGAVIGFVANAVL